MTALLDQWIIASPHPQYTHTTETGPQLDKLGQETLLDTSSAPTKNFLDQSPAVTMTTPTHMAYPTMIATAVLCGSLLWTAFLIHDVRRQSTPPPLLRCLGLLFHNIPAIYLLLTALTAQAAEDTALVWFAALMIFRYWRTIASIYF